MFRFLTFRKLLNIVRAFKNGKLFVNGVEIQNLFYNGRYIKKSKIL